MGKYTKRWNAKKPAKPTRPAPPFANFIGNYSAMIKGVKKIGGRQLFREAAKVWNTMSKVEKEIFFDRDAIEEYKEKMIAYKNTISAMKRPAGSFGLFVKEYWSTNKPILNKDNFGIIIKQISDQWNRRNENEKTTYTAASDLLKALFEEEQVAVLSGNRDLNLNWKDDGMKRVNGIVCKNQPQPAVDGEDMEVVQEEQDEDGMEEDITDQSEEFNFYG